MLWPLLSATAQPVDTLVAQGERLSAAGRFEEAAARFGAAAEHAPERADLHFRQAQYLQLDTREQEPGEYLLDLRITNGGETVVRTREITLTAPEGQGAQ